MDKKLSGNTPPNCGHCGSPKTNWISRFRKYGSGYIVVRCKDCNRTESISLRGGSQ